MIFTPTSLSGVWIIDPERMEDERGFFARSYCQSEFEAHGLNPAVSQCSISFNAARGTLRGIHCQKPPWSEAKLVRCTRGSIYDVALDLRRDSDTYIRHVATTLTAQNRRMLYISEGVYHGFLTLEDETEVFYQMSQPYHQESALGVRWNDSAFGIPWPEAVRVISKRDRAFPDFVI